MRPASAATTGSRSCCPTAPRWRPAFWPAPARSTSAPLNPAYRADEFEFYLDDLQAKALIVEQGSKSPAVEAARKLGVQVIELAVADGAPAGQFSLGAAAPRQPCASGGPAQADDVAMVLHTSGTTSRPKRVPLSVRQPVRIGRATSRRRCSSRRSDIGLNIMPLFHIHGLLAGLLAPLSAGSQVFCTPGFNALRFFKWMDEAQPDLVHGGADDAPGDRQPRQAQRRGAGAPPAALHPLVVVGDAAAADRADRGDVQGAADRVLRHDRGGAPDGVEPAAAGGSASPARSGARPAPRSRIRGEDGGLLGAGEVGEIVIRGPNVTAGYENNPKANEEAFVDGWFRTGDQGVIDADGYLSITGRLKEIINRGGEKVSPREIDEILLDHVSVAQVVVFGAPHKRLGEEVAAMVVLHEGHECDERELQQFVAKRVAGYKVPKKILFVDELPKGATGKLQRIGLAQRIGLGFGSYVSGEF